MSKANRWRWWLAAVLFVGIIAICVLKWRGIVGASSIALWQVILGLLLAYIGVEMPITPPTKRIYQWAYRGAFVVLGFAVIGLTVASQSQESKREEQHKAELKQSRDDAVNLKRDMHQQFLDLSLAFSTNAAIASVVRLAVLDSEAQHISDEQKALTNSHKIVEQNVMDLQTLRSERAYNESLRELQARQAEIQRQRAEIERQEADKRAATQRDQEDKKKKDEELRHANRVNAQSMEIFDHAITALNTLLIGLAANSGDKLLSDFPHTPTIYGSGLVRDGTIINGTNFVSLGTNPAWRIEIYTTQRQLPERRWRMMPVEGHLPILEIVCHSQAGESRFRVKPMVRGEDRHADIEGVEEVSIQLKGPNNLDFSSQQPIDNYTDTINVALRNLIEALDEQAPLGQAAAAPSK